MQDASLMWGGDIALGATGDVSLAGSELLGQQRVLRRLLTNLRDYVWQPTYGSGLGQYVGGVGDARAVEGAIRGQLYAEAAVAHQPEPRVTTDNLSQDTLLVSIVYADAENQTAQTLTFSLGA